MSGRNARTSQAGVIGVTIMATRLVACGGGDDAPRASVPVPPPVSSDVRSPVPAIPTFDCSPEVCPSRGNGASYELGDRRVDLYNATRDEHDRVPIVAIRGQRVVALDLEARAGEVRNRGWAATQKVPGTTTIVGVIDELVDRANDELLVVVSRDAGDSFRVAGRLHKPHPRGEVPSINLLGRYHWRIVLTCDACSEGFSRLYYADTEDDGATFTPFIPFAFEK